MYALSFNHSLQEVAEEEKETDESVLEQFDDGYTFTGNKNQNLKRFLIDPEDEDLLEGLDSPTEKQFETTKKMQRVKLDSSSFSTPMFNREETPKQMMR